MNRYRDASPLFNQSLEQGNERRAELLRHGPGWMSDEERAERKREYEAEQRAYDARCWEAAQTHRHALAFAAVIMEQLPGWCCGEECEVTVLDVAAALDKLGLRLKRYGD